MKKEKQYYDYLKLLSEFENLFTYNEKDDRNIAIMGSSFLEMTLTQILKTFFPQDDKEVDKLINSGNGALGTFSSKISIVYVLGLMDKMVKTDLHLFRRIRNEFDLAHGLKSDFSSFIENYFFYAINKFFKKNEHTDPLISLSLRNNYYSLSPDWQIKPDEAFEKFKSIRNNKDVNSTIHFQLFNKVLPAIFEKKWVDIELDFFQVLKDVLKLGKGLKDYNTQFGFLKKELENYLSKIQENAIININKELIVCFTEPIFKNEIVTVKLKENEKPKNIYFLNFNYANTLEDYIKNCNSIIHSTHNQIHGKLNSPENPIVFGFGDEFDHDYIEYEKYNDNSIYKHVKSFDYLKTDNYFSLIRFIDSASFQVHIYGHSCGLSDRTMLNQIFENQNCKSIKIFYYQNSENENDYTEKTYEISRHFRDKSLFRKKMVPFNLCCKMPQPHTESIKEE